MGLLPTAEEQLSLQLINRARSDPAGEMDLLFSTGDANIESAVDFFDTSESVAKSQVAGLDGVAPLAWNPYLARSADTHNDLMIFYGEQSHNLPGEPSVGGRIIAAGYNPSSAAESIYAFAESVLYAHAGFYIDWGRGPNGIQDPAGHRDAMLSAEFTEVGIAYEAYSGQGLGPFVTTQHFGRPATTFGVDPDPIIVGAAYLDLDEDLFYDVGEGLSEITVTATGGGSTFTTSTWDAGGYALTVDPDTTYEVTFSGEGLGDDQSYFVYVGSRNVARDAIVALSLSGSLDPNEPTSGDDTIIGTDGADVIDALEGDDLVIAGTGDDDVSGGAGADNLNGGIGDDLVSGGSGDDMLYAGVGVDVVDGGDGIDWLVLEGELATYSFSSLLDGSILIESSGGEPDVNTASNIEFFRFADADLSQTQLADLADAATSIQIASDDVMNVIAGSSDSNALVGTDNADEISSGGGAFDEMFGFGGADTFIFGSEAENGEVERDAVYDFIAGFDSIDLQDARIDEMFQTSQGIVLVLHGDGDVIYLQDFGLDLQDAETLLADYL